VTILVRPLYPPESRPLGDHRHRVGLPDHIDIADDVFTIGEVLFDQLFP
jgi:hypothetical protein